MKILLVEDDPSLQEGMAEALAELADVRAEGSVSQALEALRTSVFDLVMADLHIGAEQGGGREILEAARKRLAPVAMVSASTPEEVERALRPYQPDAVLTKPFSLDELLEMTRDFLSLRVEAERIAGSPPPPPAALWREIAQGIEVTPAASLDARTGSWVRMAPGVQGPWKSRGVREGLLVIEGELELNGEHHEGRHYFFLSPGQVHEARTGAGCLAVSLALRS